MSDPTTSERHNHIAVASENVVQRVRTLLGTLQGLYASASAQAFQPMIHQWVKEGLVSVADENDPSYDALACLLHTTEKLSHGRNPAALEGLPPYLLETQAALSSWLRHYGDREQRLPGSASTYLRLALCRLDEIIAWLHIQKPGGAGNDLRQLQTEIGSAIERLGQSRVHVPTSAVRLSGLPDGGVAQPAEDGGGGGSERSAPMSKAELARRILNRDNARQRDIDWSRFDLRKFDENKRQYTVDLHAVGVDDTIRERLKRPVNS